MKTSHLLGAMLASLLPVLIALSPAATAEEFGNERHKRQDVVDAGARQVGYGFLSPASAIRVRLLTRAAESPDVAPPVFVAGPAVTYASDERVVIRWRASSTSNEESRDFSCKS